VSRSRRCSGVSLRIAASGSSTSSDATRRDYHATRLRHRTNVLAPLLGRHRLKVRVAMRRAFVPRAALRAEPPEPFEPNSEPILAREGHCLVRLNLQASPLAAGAGTPEQPEQVHASIIRGVARRGNGVETPPARLLSLPLASPEISSSAVLRDPTPRVVSLFVNRRSRVQISKSAPHFVPISRRRRGSHNRRDETFGDWKRSEAIAE